MSPQRKIKQSGIGMEYMADVLDLADGACQHRGANASDRDEITRSIAHTLFQGVTRRSAAAPDGNILEKG
jgi:hypothetical protein